MKILLFNKIVKSNNDIFVSNNTKISLINVKISTLYHNWTWLMFQFTHTVWLWLRQEDQTQPTFEHHMFGYKHNSTGWVFLTSCTNYHLNQRPQTAMGANQFNSGICWVMGLHLLLFCFCF